MFDLWEVKYHGGKYSFGEFKQFPTVPPLPHLVDAKDPDVVGILIQDGDSGEVLDQVWVSEDQRLNFFKK